MQGIVLTDEEIDSGMRPGVVERVKKAREKGGEQVPDIQQDINDLAEQAVATLRAYFQEMEPDKHDETRAKIAASVFSTTARIKQAQGARDALHWSMASMLLDKEQLRQYVKVSMPNSPLSRALPEKAG